MATNGCFGHSGQYDVSEDIHIGFPMYNNMGINTKIKSLAKHTDLAILAYFQWPKWPLNGHVGHPGQPKVSENGPFLFPMFKNMGIDTKIKSLAKLTNLAILAYFWWPRWPLNGHFGHQGQPKVS